MTAEGQDRNELPDPSVLRAAHAAVEGDDAAGLRALIIEYPRLRAMIHEPLFAFDAPAIVHVRSTAMLDVLLDAGADINARSQWWAGGFGLLDSSGPELTDYALSRGAVMTPHAAARLGRLSDLARLIDADPAFVRAPGGDGQTPLHFAGSVEVATYLIDHGALIDARDVDHESTPAQYMTNGRHDVARTLVARGAATDLLLAAALGDSARVAAHLDADPDSIRMRVTPAWFPKTDPRAGGSIYQWTLGFHASAHDVARRFDHPTILNQLLERSPADVRLIDACWDGGRARALEARRAVSPLELRDDDRSLLAHAARNNRTTAVEVMVECEWPPDVRGQHDATALHWAAFHGNVAMTAALIRAGAKTDLLDADHAMTPLGWAIYGSQHGWHHRTGDYGGVVERLLAAGAARPDAIGGSAAVQDALGRGARS